MFSGAEDFGDDTSLAKWSSLDILNEKDDALSPTVAHEKQDDSIFSHSYLQRVASERNPRRLHIRASASIDMSCPASPQHSPTHQPCRTTILLIVMHAGSVLDANVDLTAKKSDVTTFRGAFESVMRQHYPSMVGHIAIRFVSCPSICTEGLGILSSLNPYSFDVSPSWVDTPPVTHDTIPIGAIPMLATSTPEYNDSVTKVINGANQIYNDFIKSDEGHGFAGQISFVGDSVGSILAYDALCRTVQYQSRNDSENSILDNDNQLSFNHDNNIIHDDGKYLTTNITRRRSSSTSDNNLQQQCKLEFDVFEFFMFGSPLSLVLAYRKISSTISDKNNSIIRPIVNQVYNLFHPTDPVAARLEPIISARFSHLPPVNIARYQKYPLGNGQPYHLREYLSLSSILKCDNIHFIISFTVEAIQTNPQIFSEGLNAPNTSLQHLRRMSDISIQSTMSGLIDNVPLHTVSAR